MVENTKSTDDCCATSCCCAANPQPQSGETPAVPPFRWLAGEIDTPADKVPVAATRLTFADHMGSWKVRWGLGRMRYSIDPGLYAVGSPTPDSPVLLSANFKLSFDHLRSRLGGRDAWVLVLDTKGINVWCAAGKGTFGTDEIVRRIADARLAEIVTHRRLIAPQLGAPGICAHEVKHRSGFRVSYGPVRAEDLPAFLDAGMKANTRMRRVRFPLRDRLVLIPVELVASLKYALVFACAFAVLAGINASGYEVSRVATLGVTSSGFLLAGWLCGTVVTPILLPWLPGRAFALKGVGVGLLCLLGCAWFVLGSGRDTAAEAPSWATVAAWILIIPAVTSFLAMNFTGSTTFTSLSGVLKEIRIALPLQIGAAVTGLALWVTGLFL